MCAQYAGAVRVEFTLRELLVVVAVIGIGAVLWVVLIGPAALVLIQPRS
jgi:prepilin-type N-terminal cleavage/methylation domain-containing protein